MNAETLRGMLSERVLVFEGGMGTLLMERVPGHRAPDLLTLDAPQVIEEIQRAYVAAGARVLQTCTFGATPIKLDAIGERSRFAEINRAAVAIARRAAGAGERGAAGGAKAPVLVAGDLGPTGRLVRPLGDLSFGDAYEAYRAQAALLAECGVDLIIVETMIDLREAKAALLAARDATGLPVVVTMTFDEHFTTPTGTDPVTAATVLSSMGAFAVGANCSTGPSPMVEVVGRMAQSCRAPIIAQPNAGMPETHDGKAVYATTPDEFAAEASRLVAAGASMLGGCCGTTPAHIEALARAVEERRPVARAVPSALRLSSRTATVEIGRGFPFAVIGERINPTNRAALSEEVLDGRVETVLADGRAQAEAGALVLDVNVGVPGVDEPAAMARSALALENALAAPLSLDSTSAAAFEAALSELAGKPLLNSVTAERARLDAILPLAARHGAGVVCLALDETGVKPSAEERVAVLRGIVREAERRGVDRENLILDCVTLAASAEQERVPGTLEAIRAVSRELGLPTVLGVSNVSHGLPDRSALNVSFLSMAMAAGLDAAIMNPLDATMMAAIRASSVLTVRDRGSAEYVRAHRAKKKSAAAPGAGAARDPGVRGRIRRAVADGNAAAIEGLVDEALAEGIAPMALNDEVVVPALEEVGRRFERREVFLPQMMLAAEAVERAFAKIKPLLPKHAEAGKGTVVLATVQGDVHDIGKNILGSMLESHGYRVVDLGKDVPAAAIVEAARRERADAVALSALMTTTAAQVPVVVQALREAGIKAKIMVGGAIVTKRFADSVGADGYAKDAAGAVGILRTLLAEDA
ncbi:MAG: homocysteine S-methyltransferase family protein [Candidatus Eisenbacteria bacterium]|nr:homocysteine S-methyltransferase family protein [Candidatus Eisenbacteria bacterium]